MPYEKVEFSQKGNVLYLELGGERTLEAARNVWQLGIREARERNIHKVIVNCDITGKLAAPDLSEFADNLETMGVKTSDRIALVSTDKDFYQECHITALFARNRGFQISAFQTIKEAEEWLTEAPDNSP